MYKGEVKKKNKKSSSPSSNSSSSSSTSSSLSHPSSLPTSQIYLIGESHDEKDDVEKKKNAVRDSKLESKGFTLIKEGVPYSIKLTGMNHYGMEDPVVNIYTQFVWLYLDYVLFAPAADDIVKNALQRIAVGIEDYDTFLTYGDKTYKSYFMFVRLSIDGSVKQIFDAHRAKQDLTKPIMDAIDNIIPLIKRHPVFSIFKTGNFIALDLGKFKSLQGTFSQPDYEALWNGVKRDLRNIVMSHWAGVTIDVCQRKNTDVAVIVGLNHVPAFSKMSIMQSSSARIFGSTNDFLTAPVINNSNSSNLMPLPLGTAALLTGSMTGSGGPLGSSPPPPPPSSSSSSSPSVAKKKKKKKKAKAAIIT